LGGAATPAVHGSTSRIVDHVLAGLGHARLDDEVVERHGLGELDLRAVLAQLVGHLVQAREHHPVAPGQLGERGVEGRLDAALAGADHLVHEAVEEDRVARLVDLLRGEEVRLLLERRRVDVRREVVGDRVLAVEEQRVQPQRAAPLLGRQLLVPVDDVLREVDLSRAPVPALPPCIKVLVADRVRCGRRRATLDGCHGGFSCSWTGWPAKRTDHPFRTSVTVVTRT
jgi:hypothetical protein